jgi:lysozyme
MRITKIDSKGLDLIKQFEGFSNKPYLDSVGIPTIGYGFTYYPDGKRVTMQDYAISEEHATMLLSEIVKPYEVGVDSMTTDLVNQNQFNALVSFAYNLGLKSLQGSTLLKKVNANPSDITIKDEFLKWVNAGGRKLKGLVNRRTKEAEVYFG